MRLAQSILARGALAGPSGAPQRVDEMVLFDTPSSAPLPLDDARVKVVRGDISDQGAVAKLIDRPDISVFHLASVVSGGGELDFDLAMRVNLYGHLHVLEALRALGSKPRHIFSSSMAVYGGAALPKEVSDSTRHVPQTTYGMTKSAGELLVNDYTRKGFIDGRCARLPAVIVRPGAPNKAASGFVSGVIREPLNGIDMALPVALETAMAVAGYRSIVDNLIELHDLDGAKMDDDRTVNLPNRTVTLREMVDSMQRVAGGRRLGKVSVTPDPFVEKIVAGWPMGLDAARAKALGLTPSADLDTVIREYISDYVK
ncbi:MAG: NAD-dependent epimerase/dehydratase family protein [Rhodospirillaceae bacterium]|nr:NAD-dependent epimerase/dehydratase family protein [Rhodospirillaceae bacterium]